MNLQKLVSILILAIFTTPIIAGPCINCVATIKKSDNHTDVSPFATKSQEESNFIATNSYSSDKNSPDYIIPLDDNEPSATTQDEYNYQEEVDEEGDNIVLIDETQNRIDENYSILGEETTLYACEDSEHSQLVCDNVSKVCECV
jgi:hypothetical protein